MLSVKRITKVFNPGTVIENIVLKDLSLSLEAGDFVTLIGGNGSGKSTLLNCIAAFTRVKRPIITDGVDQKFRSQNARLFWGGYSRSRCLERPPIWA